VVTNLGMLSGKRVLVTKISQVEMLGEPEGLMGRTRCPAGSFPTRLTGEAVHTSASVRLTCGFPRDHGHSVAYSSFYGLESSLSSEMVLNSCEAECGVTHPYIPSIGSRGGESVCLSSTYTYFNKFQNSGTICRTWARE